MARIIALDYGKKRTGIAVSDPLQLIAAPLKVIPTHTVLSFLKEYTCQESIEAIVVGWPLQLDGRKGMTARLVDQFVRLIRRHLPTIPIIRYDERFTSKLAQKSLRQATNNKQKYRKVPVDHVSASFILGSFMESTVWRNRHNIV